MAPPHRTNPPEQPARKGPWHSAEDKILLDLVEEAPQGQLNWVGIAARFEGRTPKQCRERYHQNLKPGLRHDAITNEEADLISEQVHKIGKKWAEIARMLDGRSDNQIKNWWNGAMNRKKRQEARERDKLKAANPSSNWADPEARFRQYIASPSSDPWSRPDAVYHRSPTALSHVGWNVPRPQYRSGAISGPMTYSDLARQNDPSYHQGPQPHHQSHHQLQDHPAVLALSEASRQLESRHRQDEEPMMAAFHQRYSPETPSLVSDHGTSNYTLSPVSSLPTSPMSYDTPITTRHGSFSSRSETCDDTEEQRNTLPPLHAMVDFHGRQSGPFNDVPRRMPPIRTPLPGAGPANRVVKRSASPSTTAANTVRNTMALDRLLNKEDKADRK